ncbi:glyoxylase-like metal-dependent hydrolase (beta-lactamase superfamily II) [Bacillus ectoiniformans]|uniref:MBL fold metallo-hydrolase n=1 Tax=Bacillus ectoiniformans TaxID=1494429 RepID=UPI00195A4A23|nr:MBL fold metallo-hydrolase [Bacillus ectoiniformans]MBM7649123.1 glyoxylase-like metal-dependent hydrolase (beta-lactamase superfamily II) [Bacillus ectoiniformans]
MKQPVDLGHDISIIDVFDLGGENRTGSYVIHAEEITIVETSASPSIPYLLEGLKTLGIDPSDVKNIIVTHIHLDHAGGAGLLLQACPNAKVVVHPKGKRHLADPSRLIQGAKAVYGERFDELFDPIVPIPEESLVVKSDGETLQIGENRVLTFLDTPGHANHHFSIYDPYSKGIFTGDTIGVTYPDLLSEGVEIYLPSTSPNQFNPEAMLEAVDRIEELKVERIYFGHYGMSKNPAEVYKQIRYWLPKYLEAGKQILAENSHLGFEEQSEALFNHIFSMVMKDMKEKVSEKNHAFEIAQLDAEVSAMGIIDYLMKVEVK